jgi:hypothetical protein
MRLRRLTAGFCHRSALICADKRGLGVILRSLSKAVFVDFSNLRFLPDLPPFLKEWRN